MKGDGIVLERRAVVVADTVPKVLSRAFTEML